MALQSLSAVRWVQDIDMRIFILSSTVGNRQKTNMTLFRGILVSWWCRDNMGFQNQNGVSLEYLMAAYSPAAARP